LTVYVESNFVLEVALGQEQSDAAEALLALAESGRIDLAFPAFALSEPFATVTQRGRERRRLVTQLRSQLKELARSHPHRQAVSSLEPTLDILTQIEQREADLLISAVERLLRCGTIIQTDLQVFLKAMTLRQLFGLSQQDSIIYTAVLEHLSRNATQGPHFFVNKNFKDFDDPGIRQQLAAYDCVFLGSFVDAARSLTGEDEPSPSP
jgi:predicted nucleic acid-binding protein